MSATTVLHTNICFMILDAKKKILFPKKGYSMWNYPYSLSSESFYSGSSPDPDSSSMFLIFTKWPCLTDIEHACLFLFRICASNTYIMSFPYYSKSFLYQQRDFSRVTSESQTEFTNFIYFCLVSLRWIISET